jgi:hypothetical protein
MFAEFAAHDSRLRFRSLNDAQGRTINGPAEFPRYGEAPNSILANPLCCHRTPSFGSAGAIQSINALIPKHFARYSATIAIRADAVWEAMHEQN